MKWLEVTADLVLPKGTQLLALRKRSKFPSPYHDETKPKWSLLDAIIVDRVGDICGENHPDANRLTWYGSNYQSAHHTPTDSYSHYALLSDLELPPIGDTTPEEQAKHDEWVAQDKERSRRWSKMFSEAYEKAFMADQKNTP